MAVNIAPVYVDAQLINGIPASGGKLFTYVAGSSTKQTTYQDAAGATPHANPIILNSRGEPANNGGVSMPIFLTAGLTYDFVFAPSTDTDPPTAAIRTIAGIKGVNDVSSLTDQFIASGITPTFVSATQFTLPGDQTSAFTVGRSLKSSVTAGTVYDTIAASVFTTLTTVTVIGGALDSGLSSVSYGIITSVNPSLPTIPTATAIASAATIDFRAIKSNEVHVTGTVAISSVLMLTGQRIKLIADAALPLTYNATTNNIIGAASYTLTAGDTVDYDYDGVTVRGVINKADGTAIVSSIVTSKIQSVSSSVAGNALTLNYNGGTLDFRSSSLTSGVPVTLTVAANSITIPSGASLNAANGVLQRYALLEAYNGGSPVACIAALFGGMQLDETNLISPTIISTASNNNAVIYSASAVSANSPYRVVGFFDVTAASSGLWSTDATLKQGIGGEALTALSSVGYGQTLQTFTVGTNRISGTTYINTTGKPIMLYINVSITSGTYSFAVDGTVVSTNNSSAGSFQINWLIPTGITYAMTFTTVAATRWFELRT